MASEGNERRRFHRFPVEGNVRLFSPSHMWSSDLLDLSLRGCLIKCPDDFVVPTGNRFRLDIRLAGGIMIGMTCTLARAINGNLAFACEKIDLDSFIKLKRLVEINLGNTGVLYRELSELSSA